jgi:hypothetical protein
MFKAYLVLVLFALPVFSLSQASSAPQWQSSKIADISSGTRNIQFTLAGKFIAAPQSSSADHPTLVVTCNPERRGPLGKLVSTSLNTGAPLKIDYVEPLEIKEGIDYYPKVTVQVRLNDGKAEEAQWPPNSDKTGAILDKGALKKLIYHRKIPVRSVVISATENRGGQIVMQIDMPDPTEMVNTCGIAERK